MDSKQKKDLLKTVLMAAFFLIVALILLDVVIGNSMDPEPPRL